MTSRFDRLAEQGIELKHYREGTQRVPCPECDRGPKDSALSVTVEHDAAVWQCFRCGWRGAVRERRESTVRPPERSQVKRREPERHDTLAPRWREFWAACEPVTTDSIAGRYLAARNCALSPIDGDLRWHDATYHWPSQSTMPAMVGLITDAISKAPRSLHFTYLKADGSGKADVERAKLLLPRHRKSGGVIRLWPDEAVTYSIGFAEGIESALSLAHSHSPVWACVDAGNLAALPVLSGIESVLVAVDYDVAGLKAYDAFARRWTLAGVAVYHVLPSAHGLDLNDEARAA